MHQYHFSYDQCEFDLLASSNEVLLCDESSNRKAPAKFCPVWTMKGDATVEAVEAKIRGYLYGKK